MTHEDLLNLPVVVALSAHKRYSGFVRKVGADFLLIHDSLLGMVLVPLEHVKQFRLGDKMPAAAASPPQVDAASAPIEPVALPDSLSTVLRNWTESVVQLDGGGPDLVVAYVLDVRADYLIASVIPEGTVYVPVHHIQLVRPLDVTVQAEFTEWANRQKALLPAATRFVEALRHETGSLVKIGRGGPDEVIGILRAVDDKFVELVVSPHELVRIPMHHVKTVSRQQRFDFQALEETAHA